MDRRQRGAHRPPDVTPAEVEEIVNTRPRWEAKGRDDTTLLYGQTDAGRYLFVVVAESVMGPAAGMSSQPATWNRVRSERFDRRAGEHHEQDR